MSLLFVIILSSLSFYTPLCPTLLISVSDLDPFGSVLKRLPWILILIRREYTDPDPGKSKLRSNRKKNLTYQAEKSMKRE